MRSGDKVKLDIKGMLYFEDVHNDIVITLHNLLSDNIFTIAEVYDSDTIEIRPTVSLVEKPGKMPQSFFEIVKEVK